MKKILLTVLFVTSVLLFNSCDDSLPAVNATEGNDAVMAALASLYGSYDAIYENYSGVTYDGLSSTFTAFDLTVMYEELGETLPYTSVSGTIKLDVATTTMTYDLTFSGGPVITLYIVMDYMTNVVSILELNGHDMKSELDLDVLAGNVDV